MARTELTVAESVPNCQGTNWDPPSSVKIPSDRAPTRPFYSDLPFQNLARVKKAADRPDRQPQTYSILPIVESQVHGLKSSRFCSLSPQKITFSPSQKPHSARFLKIFCGPPYAPRRLKFPPKQRSAAIAEANRYDIYVEKS